MHLLNRRSFGSLVLAALALVGVLAGNPPAAANTVPEIASVATVPNLKTGVQSPITVNLTSAADSGEYCVYGYVEAGTVDSCGNFVSGGGWNTQLYMYGGNIGYNATSAQIYIDPVVRDGATHYRLTLWILHNPTFTSHGSEIVSQALWAD